MADRRHAEFFEVLGRQLGQDYLVYRVFPECPLVAFQAEAAQPGRDIHGVHTHTSPYSSAGDSRRQLREPGRGQAAHQNEELSLPQPRVRITFFGSLVSEDQCRRGLQEKGAQPNSFSLADTVIG